VALAADAIFLAVGPPKASVYCRHDLRRIQCRECASESDICEHAKERSQCEVCDEIDKLLDRDTDYIELSSRFGVPVTYGSVLQLVHVKTKQYIAMTEGRIKLVSQPSCDTLIKLLPAERSEVTAALRTKTVRYTEKVSLLNTYQGQEQCFIDSKAQARTTSFATLMSWQLKLSATHDQRDDYLRQGDLVALLHENFGGFVTVPVETVGYLVHEFDHTVAVRLKIQEIDYAQDEANFRRTVPICEHSWMFWEVIKAVSPINLLDGGLVLMQERIHLRHFVTGKYLVAHDQSKQSGEGDVLSSIVNKFSGSSNAGNVTLTAQGDTAGVPPQDSVFIFSDRNEALNPYIDTKAGSYFIETGDMGHMIAHLQAPPESPTEVVHMGRHYIERDRFKLVRPGEAYESEVYVALCCVREIVACFPNSTSNAMDLKVQIDRTRSLIVPKLVEILTITNPHDPEELFQMAQRQRMLGRLGLIENIMALCAQLIHDNLILTDHGCYESSKVLIFELHKCLQLICEHDRANLRKVADKRHFNGIITALTPL